MHAVVTLPFYVMQREVIHLIQSIETIADKH